MVQSAVITGTVLAENGQPLLVHDQPSRISLLTYLYDRQGDRKLDRAPGVSYPSSFGAPAVDINDRGEYRFYDVPPGEYYLATAPLYTEAGDFVAPVYYPGTTNRAQAEPIRVEAGGNVRLPTLIVRPVKMTHVRFRPVMSDAVIEGRRNVFIDYGNVSSFEFAASDKVITRSVLPGHYDFFMALGTPSMDRVVYGVAAVDVPDKDVEIDVILKGGYHVAGSLTIEDQAGNRTVLKNIDTSASIHCNLLQRQTSFQSGRPCIGSDFAPGVYRLDISELPQDAFVKSVRLNGANALGKDIQLDRDSTLEIEVLAPGGSVEGKVTDGNGVAIPDAIVGLVPDSPFRHGPYLYRSVTSDINGHFELRGITPGSYHVFSWYELEGEAYRNEDFLKDFEDKGIGLRIERGQRLSVEVPVLCHQADSACPPSQKDK